MSYYRYRRLDEAEGGGGSLEREEEEDNPQPPHQEEEEEEENEEETMEEEEALNSKPSEGENGYVTYKYFCNKVKCSSLWYHVSLYLALTITMIDSDSDFHEMKLFNIMHL